jgi:hypothetical protein
MKLLGSLGLLFLFTVPVFGQKPGHGVGNGAPLLELGTKLGRLEVMVEQVSAVIDAQSDAAAKAKWAKVANDFRSQANAIRASSLDTKFDPTKAAGDLFKVELGMKGWMLAAYQQQSPTNPGSNWIAHFVDSSQQEYSANNLITDPKRMESFIEELHSLYTPEKVPGFRLELKQALKELEYKARVAKSEASKK